MSVIDEAPLYFLKRTLRYQSVEVQPLVLVTLPICEGSNW